MKTKILIVKTCVIILIFTGFTSNLKSQSAYYDALTLSDKSNLSPDGSLNPNDIVYSVLAAYSDKNNPTNSDLDIEFDGTPGKNPFITVSGGPHALKAFSSIQKGISSIGGLNVSSFADGLAKFMVERFKQELSLAFFTKFKEDLSDPKYTDLKILFPETEKTLTTIDTDIYQFSLYLNVLRQSFIRDMSMQFINLQHLLNQLKYRDYFEKQRPELGSILYTSFYLVNGFSSGKHPGEIFADFNPYFYIKMPGNVPLDSNLIASVNIIKLVSTSFRSVSSTNYWVPSDSAGMLLQDNVAFNIFMGLLYQEGKDINFMNSVNGNILNFREILMQAAVESDSLREYRIFLENFMYSAQEVNEYLSVLKEKEKPEIETNDYYKLFNASLDLLAGAMDFTDLPFVDLDPDLEQKFKKTSSDLLYVAGSALELYIDVKTKNYSSGMMNTLGILDVLVDYTDDTRKHILKYGTFIATVAEAQNPEDVKNAIESAALPAGSYSVKRNSKCNIAFNGYLGFGYDRGNPFGNTEGLAAREKYDLNLSLSAPVGISFSTGLAGKGHIIKENKHLGSASLFVSMIDIGSIANFRIKDDTTLLKRTISLSDIFSPGLCFIYGIPRTPISLSAGCVYKPKLLFDNNQNEIIGVPGMFRWNFSICVDIPFVNLKTIGR